MKKFRIYCVKPGCGWELVQRLSEAAVEFRLEDGACEAECPTCGGATDAIEVPEITRPLWWKEA